jgi:hypothetical protein
MNSSKVFFWFLFIYIYFAICRLALSVADTPCFLVHAPSIGLSLVVVMDDRDEQCVIV